MTTAIKSKPNSKAFEENYDKIFTGTGLRTSDYFQAARPVQCKSPLPRQSESKIGYYDKIFYKGETQGATVILTRKEYDDCKTNKEIYDLIQFKQPVQLELPLEEYPENTKEY